jgi:hypothetical protein
MTTIPVTINDEYKAVVLVNEIKSYSGIRFIPDNGLTPEQIAEVQEHFSNTYQGQYVLETSLTYTTNA